MAASVETAQGEIVYSITGDGPPIVLLPGFQSNRSGWLAPNNYLDLLADYQVISVDPLGHGKSAMSYDAADYSAHNVVEHILAVMDDVGVDAAHLWGFSRGGMTAALVGELRPKRCRSIIMGGSPLGAARQITESALRAGEPFLADGEWVGYWKTYPVPLPEFLTAHFEATNDPRACAAAIRAMLRWDDEVPNYGLNPSPIPRLAYFGEGEVFADELERELSKTDIVQERGTWAGHAETMLDRDGVVAVVRRFLDSIT